MKTAIWWIRRDIRLHDNHALAAALQSGDAVLPLFISDPGLHSSPYFSPLRWAFLLAGLRMLDQALEQRGSRLFFFEGRPEAALNRLIQERYADSIFAEEDITPYAKKRDARIRASLPLHITPGLSLLPPGTITARTGKPYRVYSPFRNAFLSHPLSQGITPLPAPTIIPLPDKAPSSIPIPPLIPTGNVAFPPGEREGLRRLALFTSGDLAGIIRYEEGRNGLAEVGSAGLSPYFRAGMLSIQSAFTAATHVIQSSTVSSRRKSADKWRDQLIWREFFINILDRHPHARSMSLRPEFREIAWLNREEDFQAWKDGKTGYPLVDGAMRQLKAKGWIPNRARLVVASFLVKHLLVDWRWGERWFMKQLIDGDPAQNNGGWQWSAGTGTDAAPYFRIFNPILQSKRFDPDGDYIRRWVPELDGIPPAAIHEPWRLSEEERNGYPLPSVEHKYARERALETYSAARQIAAETTRKPD